MQLPAAFQAAMKIQLGGVYGEFEEALSTPPSVSIRSHSSKLKNWKENLDGVKWNTKGVYLPKRPVFTLDPSFHAGAYYVQEASSMFVAEAVRQMAPESGETGLKVLDLCAAPGGKSTLLLDELPAGSFLLSNEVIRNRFQILKYNLIKWGQPAMAASQLDSARLKPLTGFFDIVLVDAPCSGEGLFRKTPEAMKEWSPDNVQLCAARQKRILAEAMPLVKAGGHLIYCTCTYNRQENEENAAWICQEGDFAPFSLSIPAEWGILPQSIGYQFYPHRVRGEGFYLASFQKQGTPNRIDKRPKRRTGSGLVAISKKERLALSTWIDSPEAYFFFKDKHEGIRALPAQQSQTAEQLYQHWPYLFMGLEVGTFKGKDFVPAPSLALSTMVHPDVPRLALDLPQALAYLRKETMEGLETIPRAWQLVTYDGLGLGWIKGLGNRYNNYYPKDWRIRMKKT